MYRNKAFIRKVIGLGNGKKNTKKICIVKIVFYICNINRCRKAERQVDEVDDILI